MTCSTDSSRRCCGACRSSSVASSSRRPNRCAGSVTSRISTWPDLLGSLVDKSLVVADTSATHGPLPASRDHPPVRGRKARGTPDTDEAAGGEPAEAAAAHAAYYLGYVDELAPRLTGRSQETWLTRLEEEYPNLRAAAAHLVSDEHLVADEDRASDGGRTGPSACSACPAGTGGASRTGPRSWDSSTGPSSSAAERVPGMGACRGADLQGVHAGPIRSRGPGHCVRPRRSRSPGRPATARLRPRHSARVCLQRLLPRGARRGARVRAPTPWPSPANSGTRGPRPSTARLRGGVYVRTTVTAAEAIYQEALSVVEQSGDLFITSFLRNNYACLLLLEGRVADSAPALRSRTGDHTHARSPEDPRDPEQPGTGPAEGGRQRRGGITVHRCAAHEPPLR